MGWDKLPAGYTLYSGSVQLLCSEWVANGSAGQYFGPAVCIIDCSIPQLWQRRVPLTYLPINKNSVCQSAIFILRHAKYDTCYITRFKLHVTMCVP